jgi:hypothetical protein
MHVTIMRKEWEASGVGGPRDALHPACVNREAWPGLNERRVECCGICHDLYPQYDLRWARLKGGDEALVCCAVDRALSSSPPQSETEAEALSLLRETFKGSSEE